MSKLSRFLPCFFLSSLLPVSTGWSGEALAQLVTLKNNRSNVCYYTAVHIANDRTIEVECSTTKSPGTIGFSSTSATKVPDGTPVALVVQRTENFGGDTLAQARYSCTSTLGYSPTYPQGQTGLLSFVGNGEQPFSILPGSLPASVPSATVTCSLSDVSGAGLGAARVFTLTVVNGSSGTPGAVAFASVSANTSDNGSDIPVAVVRSGSTGAAPTVTANYSCTATNGYVPTYPSGSSSGSLTFSANETKSFVIRASALPTAVASAKVTCTITSVSAGASIGSNGSYELTVTASGGGSSCPLNPNQLYDVTPRSDFYRATIEGLRADQVAAVKFRPTDQTTLKNLSLNVAPTVGQYEPLGMQVVISECPADFQNIPPGNELRPANCGLFGESSQLSFNARSEAPYAFFQCRLDPSKLYYLNVRWKNPDTGESRCAQATCGANVNFSYSQ